MITFTSFNKIRKLCSALQLQDQSSNGDHNSPRKSSGKNTARTAPSPTKPRSLSRGSKSPNPKTPDSPTPSIPSDKKSTLPHLSSLAYTYRRTSS